MGMIFINTEEVAGFYPALYGMRNPMNSHSKMDSFSVDIDLFGESFVIGENDMKLAKTLVKGGSEHRKFLRQIQVWASVSMPRYWWSEADTYKFGTKNSESTMHTLFKNPITTDDFYLGEMNNGVYSRVFDTVLQELNYLRETNYEELMNMYHQRKNHRLKDEWGVFTDWCESLPYFKELCIDE
jgi:hypothetical protein